MMKEYSKAINFLPYLPVPDLNETLEKYLQVAEIHLTTDVHSKTREAAKKFADGSGGKLQEMLLERAAKTDNWLSDLYHYNYLSWRNQVPVLTSPSMVWPKQKFNTELDRQKYTAKVISAALKYKDMIEHDQIPLDYLGGLPCDMSQYGNIFTTCRIPGHKRDSLMFYPDSKHIVLIIDNQFYKVPVYVRSHILSEDQILAQIQLCFGGETNEAPIGLLTSDKRENWAKAYEELIKDPVNKASIETIQSALFFVALDKTLDGDDDVVTATYQMSHGGGLNSGNRWYDKTLGFVISADGINGLVFEHALCDGVPIANLADFIVSTPTFLTEEITGAPIKPVKLSFNVSPAIDEALKTAEINIETLRNNLLMNYLHFTKFGTNFIKSHKMSPDAFIQMALQYTFYKLHWFPGAHYETATARRFSRGRTEAIRTCSQESLTFAQAMLNDIPETEKFQRLKDAVTAHKNYAVAISQGVSVDRHLYALKLLAMDCNMEIPEFYTNEGYVQSNQWNIMSSQVPCKFDGFMYYGSKIEHGYGICYNPRGDSMWFAIASHYSDSESDSMKFRQGLEESFNEMYELVIKCSEN